MKRRVVVTGVGTVSPIGLDVPSTWDGVISGKSGVGPTTKFDASEYKTRISAEIKGFDPREHFDRRAARRFDPFVMYGLVAAREAVRDADITFDDSRGERTAVIIGSGIGGMLTITQQTMILHEKGPNRVSPFLIPMCLPETAASLAAIEFGLKGPNFAVTSACATGANAVGEAFEMIRKGAVDAALCGGTEAGVHPVAVAGFSVMGALSQRNDEPERASRPFDVDRDGFIVGEGAGVLLLEELETARSRGARIYGELVGYASTDDAYHITAPDENGAGMIRCMLLAMEDADLTAGQIDYINAHGTSTPLNDVAETKAIKAAFGAHAYEVAISSTKSVTGHLLGGAGALEAILCIKAMEHNILPPTMNHDIPDPGCDLDYVPNKARETDVSVAMSNSFGFGGHNVCLIFSQLEES